jgi:hypothetical protein
VSGDTINGIPRVDPHARSAGKRTHGLVVVGGGLGSTKTGVGVWRRVSAPLEAPIMKARDGRTRLNFPWGQQCCALVRRCAAKRIPCYRALARRFALLMAETNSSLFILVRPEMSKRRATSIKCFLLAFASTPSSA